MDPIYSYLPFEMLVELFQVMPIAILSAMHHEYGTRPETDWHAKMMQNFIFSYFGLIRKMVDHKYKANEMEIENGGWFEVIDNPVNLQYRSFVNVDNIEELNTQILEEYHLSFKNLKFLKIRDAFVREIVRFMKMSSLTICQSTIESGLYFNNMPNLTEVILIDVECSRIGLMPLAHGRLVVFTLVNHWTSNTFSFNEDDIIEVITANKDSLRELNYMEMGIMNSNSEEIIDILYFVCSGEVKFPKLRKLGGNMYRWYEFYENSLSFPPELITLELCFQTMDAILFRWDEIREFTGYILLRETMFLPNGLYPFFDENCVKKKPTKGKLHIMPLLDDSEFDKCFYVPYFTRIRVR